MALGVNGVFGSNKIKKLKTKNMEGKIIVVTGANSGLGKETATVLATKGAKIILVCRNETRGEAARQEIIKITSNDNITLEICDLSSKDSIHNCGLSLHQKYKHIDVLVNNAGAIFGTRATNSEGLERTFALNVMGYFRLTHYLLDLLKKGNDKRIINVASYAHNFAKKIPWDDLQFETTPYRQLYVYGLSKLYDIYFTKQLAKMMDAQQTGITVNAVHPGTVHSNFGKSGTKLFYIGFKIASPFYDNVKKGAKMAIHMASSPEAKGINGAYYAHMKKGKLSPLAQSDQDAKRLWDKCMEIANIKTYGVLDKI
jgi:NAD(P)-dependent dehydrogenase (short-subunit alcohol dehydrogenase family)